MQKEKEFAIKDSDSFYTVCRKIAKLTQEQAISLLDIQDASTLSNYENLKVKPKPWIVADMVKVYRTPELMPWHIKQWYPEFSKYIVEPVKINSSETLQSNVARSNTIIADLFSTINKIFMDDEMDESEKIELIKKSPLIDLTIEKLISVKEYIGNLQ